jgi:Protein of unknown function (DUF4230)
MKKLIGLVILALVLFGATFGGAYFYQKQLTAKMEGQVQSIATASLTGLREQARLTPFVASFVAVVTSKQERLGLTAERTMILPGLVRYELDLAAIRQQDVKWDKEAKLLVIKLPPIQLAGPQVDMEGIREYGEGGILMTLTDAKQTLDEANRKQGQAELLAQAKGAVPMKLARDAARSAIERSFAMPLRAAGIKARVEAHFAGEGDASAEQQQEEHE